jgi:hypothetical protein
MNTSKDRGLTPRDRDRALARLQRLTIGAAVSALVAVSGAGYVAAASYSGKSVASTATILQSGTSSSAATTASSTSTTSSASSLVAPTAAPTSSGSGAAAVTTGGS